MKHRSVAAGIANALSAFGAGAFRNCVVLAGAASIAYGTWLYSPPLGFIVGGVLLVAGGVAPELAKDPAAG